MRNHIIKCVYISYYYVTCAIIIVRKIEEEANNMCTHNIMIAHVTNITVLVCVCAAVNLPPKASPEKVTI